MEALGLGGFKQQRRSGDEDDLRRLEHIAGHQRSAQLPAEAAHELIDLAQRTERVRCV